MTNGNTDSEKCPECVNRAQWLVPPKKPCGLCGRFAPVPAPIESKEEEGIPGEYIEFIDGVCDAVWGGECGWETTGLKPLLAALRKQLVVSRQTERSAVEALEEYANPENYHAVAFLFDRPCGGFADDFSDDHGHPDYDRAMPGKLARETLRALQPKDGSR